MCVCIAKCTVGLTLALEATSHPGSSGAPIRGITASHSAPDLDMDTLAKRSQSERTGIISAGSSYNNLEIQFSDPNAKVLKNADAAEQPTLRAAAVTSPQSSDMVQKAASMSVPSNLRENENDQGRADRAIVSGLNPDELGADEGTAVSSLTGAGFDQEIVEELHQALTEMKAELEASRAEAARAVKVAEQAIQSAEQNSSKDWNSTVTHKAAEAAALAQKKSAEAMSKQRLAEERLSNERKTSSFWRKQAEAAEEEAGALQTRAAAAEIHRLAMMDELQSERTRTAKMIANLQSRLVASETNQRESINAVLDRTRSLEIELDGARRDSAYNSARANSLEDDLGEL